MTKVDELFDSLREITSINDPEAVIDMIERPAQSRGATHIIVTGLPMPNRPIEKLLLRVRWSDERTGGGTITEVPANDPVLNMCYTGRRPVNWHLEAGREREGFLTSELMHAAAGDGRIRLVAVPIREINPYQGCVICAGTDLGFTDRELVAYDHLCQAAMRRLMIIGKIGQSRPGDLSARERRVLELTAIGKTASEIAQLLQISQRTVHAHLQNASEKLNASNKTHTVVEALRHAQIEL